MSYLKLATLGKNQWWRYVLSVLVIVFFWQIIGALPTLGLALMAAQDNDAGTYFDTDSLQFVGFDPILPYLTLSFSFVMLWIGLWLSIRLLHNRSFLSLITVAPSLHWGRLFQGFWVYLGLMGALTVAGLVLSPEEYRLTFDAKQFLLFLPLALVLTPLQAAAEELLFRGYLMQTVGLASQNKVLVAVVSGLLFMVPHLWNPEAKLDPILMPLTYFFLGFFMAIISLKDNSLELAIGAHAANNLFTFLFTNYEGSAVKSPSIFTQASIEPLSGLISFIVIGALFYFIVFYLFPNKK